MPRAPTKADKSVEKASLVFDGKPLVPNDHVYVSAPWDDREGEPYLIARVLEVVQPTPKSLVPPSGASASTSSKSSRAETPSGKETSAGRVVVSAHELRVRVAYYFRTRDITTRYVADHRLLVAAMHADTVPASYIRGLCTVRHRDHIEELDVYKREKDTFYWHQLYDRYLHRYFDAVPTYKVQNAPADVLKHLQNSFEFVLCEVGTGSELCDAQRGCSVCCKWAAFADSVTCARCTKVFHLGCVDPPLAAKPKAGYGWSCAPCNKAYEEEVEEFGESGFRLGNLARKPIPAGSASGSTVPPGASQMLHASRKGKAREVGPGARVDPHEWRMTNGWPFRYFGMHAHAYNVLDPHDSLHPRASTRLGNKFQCVVPNWDPVLKQQEAPPEQRQYFQPKRSRASTPVGKNEREKARRAKLVEAPPRGEDEAVTIIWRPAKEDNDKSLADLFERVKKMAVYNTAGVDALNRALVLYHAKNGDVTEAILSLRKASLGSLGHVSWNEEDRKKLADGAAQHHNDLEEIAKLLPNKKLGDVVKRYYVQVGHTLQEDEPTQPEEKATAVAARSKKTTKRKAKAADDADAEGVDAAGDDSDHGSVAPPARTPFQRKNRFCAICSTTETPKWYRCPNNISELDVKPNPLIMCESCGIRWRHYGAQYPPYGDEIKPLPDRKKKAKAASEDGKKEASLPINTPTPVAAPIVKEPTPPPPKPVIVPKPCLLCKRFEPKTALFQCRNCTVSYHASCFGIDLDWDWPHEEWLCHMCERDQERKPLCLHPFCVLCPTPKDIALEMPMTALDCMKETEMSNYIHLLCAVWHRELQLGAPAILSPVEAFTLLPSQRQHATCVLCKQRDVGTTVKCEDCSKHVHVACAWNAGWKFAFEVQQVRNKKRPPKDAVMVKFKETEGVLQPCIWCTDHHFTHAERKTYDLGARDQASKLTALQMYVRTYKAVKHPDAPLLLRQGRRLEAVLEPAVKPEPPKLPPPPARARAGRSSLISTIIDEENALPETPPNRSAKRRRTSSTTPAASPAPRSARAPRAKAAVQPKAEETNSYPAMGLDKPSGATAITRSDPIPDRAAPGPAESEPLPNIEKEDDLVAHALVSTSRRARVPKPPKHFSPPPPLVKKPPKKRKSRTSSVNELDSLATIVNGSHADPRKATMDVDNLRQLLVEAAANDSTTSKPRGSAESCQNNPLSMPSANGLPAFSALPKLPSFNDFRSPHFSAVTSAPHLLDSLVYTAQTPTHQQTASYPDTALQNGQSDARHAPSALDPALEALTTMAAARADSRDAAVAAASSASSRSAMPSGSSLPTEQETIRAFAALAGLPSLGDVQAPANGSSADIASNGHGEGPGDPPSAATVAAAASSDAPPPVSGTPRTSTTAVADGDVEHEGTPSGRPKRKTRAPAALRETTAYEEGATTPDLRDLRRLAPTSPRPHSPAQPEPIHAHPILDYVRAHASAQQSFRVETPDDSDAASERFDSPALPNLSPVTSAGPTPHWPFGSPLASVDALPTPPHLLGLQGSAPLAQGPAQAPPAPPSSSRPPGQKRRKSTAAHTGPPITCANCGTSDSPLFRRDSEGRQLCNSCGLYFKTHGRDRPQKVIARAIGAARMQKRKQADLDAGGTGNTSGGKRAKKVGTPLPLRAMPPLLPHAPAQPSPLQPGPSFTYGDYLPYPPNGAFAGPSGSGAADRPSASRSSSGGASGLDGTLSGGYTSDYPAPYGYGATNGQQATSSYDARIYGHQLPPLPTHLEQQTSQPQYLPTYPSLPSPSGALSALGGASPRADYGAATPPVDAELLQRHALESLAAQALTFGAAGPDPASLAQARSSLNGTDQTSTADVIRSTQEAAPIDVNAAPNPSTPSTSTHPLASRVQADDALEHGGQPSPPPSASAMPLGELFPSFAASGPVNASRPDDADETD